MEAQPLTDSVEQGRVDLNNLISEVAMRLMPASLVTNASVSRAVLERLCSFFDVDVSFYRRHDRDRRVTILVAEWPPRPFVPDPDPLAVLPFEANPVFAATEHLDRPMQLLPGVPETETYQRIVAEASGMDAVTVLTVPLRSETCTDGVMGLVREGMRPFAEDEILALKSIAALLYQAQSRVEAERRLREAAFHDSLTGLENRLALADAIESRLDSGQPLLLAKFDVLDLRTINDTLGRKAGDKLISQFADDLRALGRTTWRPYRVSGNGFVMLGADLGESVEESLEPVQAMYEELSAMEVRVGDRSIRRSLSVGVARSESREIDAEGLIRECERALATAEQRPDAGVVLYDREHARAKREEKNLEMALREALACDDQILVHYQPEVDLRSGKLVGYEALARWQHPDRGLLPAGVFIEMAEHSGLVVPLSRKVLQVAIAQQAYWLKQDPKLDTKVRINVSPAQLIGTDIAVEVGELLQRYHLQPEHICIEVTEHVVMDYSDEALGALQRLRDAGVEIAIDDFGIGHSSIAKLKYLPADTLKIDRAFITSLVDTHRDRALVDTIIRMAKAFDMHVVAEGVETEEELVELLQLGADFSQGYYFGRPMAPEAISTLFHTRLFDPAVYRDKKRAVGAQRGG